MEKPACTDLWLRVHTLCYLHVRTGVGPRAKNGKVSPTPRNGIFMDSVNAALDFSSGLRQGTCQGTLLAGKMGCSQPQPLAFHINLY